MKDFKLSFFTRPSKSEDKETLRIFARLIVNKERLDFSVNRYVKKESWDASRNSIKGKDPVSVELGKYIATVEECFYKCERQLIEQGIPVSTESLLRAYRAMKSGEDLKKEKTLMEVFDLQIKDLKELLAIGSIVKPTVTRYQTTKTYLIEFITEKYNKTDINLKDLDYVFVKDFDHWLRIKKSCAHNTTVKYIKNLKRIIKICLDHNWLTLDPFRAYKEKSKSVSRDYLTIEELRSLESLVIRIPRLDKVRQLFLFSCYTGLSYIDLFSLTKENLQRDNTGGLWIIKARKKTKVISRIFVLPAAEELINSFSDHPQAIQKNTLFPPMSNQRLNGYLKELSDLLGITKNLTFHVARHTFATTVTLANGVSLESVSAQLGHTNIRQTQHYAKMVSSRIGNEMTNLKGIFKKSE